MTAAATPIDYLATLLFVDIKGQPHPALLLETNVSTDR